MDELLTLYNLEDLETLDLGILRDLGLRLDHSSKRDRDKVTFGRPVVRKNSRKKLHRI